MSKLIIALQYYEGDRAAAVRLLNLMVDIEVKNQINRALEGVDICLVGRADCEPITKAEVMPLGSYFEVSRMSAGTEYRGHPQACNSMAAYVFDKGAALLEAGLWKDVSGILMLEPDCVPVSLDWIDQLRAEWALANRLMEKPLVLGCYRDKGVDRPHVNGVAIWRPDLFRQVRFPLPDCGLGWDSALAPQLEHRIFKTSLISNLFKETNVPRDRLEHNPFAPRGTPAPVLIHGVKDGSAWQYAKEIMGL